MIGVFSFHPEHFNNNGDQGNLEVLQAELLARGAEVSTVSDLALADFVLIGDASRAAMAHYRAELDAIRESLVDRFSRGRPTLVVGSSYEYFADNLGLITKQISRKSEFVLQDGFFGYRNTELDLPPVFRNGLFIATSLFGPFLAKNPELLSEYLVEFGVGQEIDQKRSEWVTEIRRRSIDG